jgi:hypothetical protein
LPAGSPSGGTFSGPGVNGSNFNSANAGTGTHTITYSVTQSGCTGSTTSTIVVDACSGMEDTELNSIIVFPNPTSGLITIEGLTTDISMIELIDASGKTCGTWNVNSMDTQLDLSSFATGSYTLNFKGAEIKIIKRITIKK